MKAALLFEQDSLARKKTAQLLKWFGYLVVPARTAGAALSAATSLAFEVIITCTTTKPDDRRSLTGELKRAAPRAAVVLIVENNDEYVKAQRRYHAGVGAITRRSTLLDTLQRMILSGTDEVGSRFAHGAAGSERRAKLT